MKIEIEISDDKICGLLAAAREGGIRYWVRSIDVIASTEPDPIVFINDRPEGTRWAPIYTTLLSDGFWEVYVLPDGNDARANKAHRLDRMILERGLMVMRSFVPKQFARVIDGTYDAGTGDVFLQCCLFGEVIYG